MARTTLTSNLKLRLSSDLTADSRYNLNRLDSLGSIFQITTNETAVLRSQTDINIQPNDPDIGGSGTGGIINFGTVDQPASTININADTFNFSADIASDNNITTTGSFVLSANNYDISLSAPAGLANNYSLLFPLDDGTPNQVLTTDGSGNLYWSTVVGGGTGGQELAVSWTPADGITKTINHNFGTRQIMVQILDAEDNYRTINIDSITRPNDNDIVLIASEIPVNWLVLLKQIT